MVSFSIPENIGMLHHSMPLIHFVFGLPPVTLKGSIRFTLARPSAENMGMMSFYDVAKP